MTTTVIGQSGGAGDINKNEQMTDNITEQPAIDMVMQSGEHNLEGQ